MREGTQITFIDIRRAVVTMWVVAWHAFFKRNDHNGYLGGVFPIGFIIGRVAIRELAFLPAKK
jgi:peptidoglycan/LPS O-acetylase OafA/YrhL